MEKHDRDPQRAHPELTECERASLAHVDPDVNLEEEEFYFHHRGERPSMEEFRKAQPASGCFFGTETHCTDAEYDIPTYDCLATTEHPCSGNPRNALDRGCRHAHLSKDMGATRKLSSSTLSKVMNFVACFQSHPMTYSSNSTAAM